MKAYASLLALGVSIVAADDVTIPVIESERLEMNAPPPDVMLPECVVVPVTVESPYIRVMVFSKTNTMPYSINEKTITEVDLARMLNKLAGYDTGQPILVKYDDQSDSNRIQAAFSIAQACGLTNLSSRSKDREIRKLERNNDESNKAPEDTSRRLADPQP